MKKVFIGLIVLLILLLAISVAADPVEPDIGSNAPALTALQVHEHPAAAVVPSAELPAIMGIVALNERPALTLAALAGIDHRPGSNDDYGLSTRTRKRIVVTSTARSSPEARCRDVK